MSSRSAFRRWPSIPGPGEISILLAVSVTFLVIAFAVQGWIGPISREALFISSRALATGSGNPADLRNLGLVYPPLHYLLSSGFATFRLWLPPVWVTCAGAGIFCAWMFARFLRTSGVGIWAASVVPLNLLWPGFIQGTISGSSDQLYAILLVPAIYFLGTFILDQQLLTEAVKSGRFSAWMDSAAYQHDRIRYVWAGALQLAAASLVRFDLILLLPLLIAITPFFLVGEPQKGTAKVFTLVVLLYLPLIAFLIMIAFLSGIYTGDFLYPLHNPLNYFRLIEFQSSADNLLLSFREQRWAIIVTVATSPLFSCFLFPYLLWRIRCWPLAVLCLVPFLQQILALRFGQTGYSQSYFVFSPLLSTMLFLFGVRYGRFHAWERRVLPIGFLIALAVGWISFLHLSNREEQWFSDLAFGRPARSFAKPEILGVVRLLDQRKDLHRILIDENAGYEILALVNQPDRFVVNHATGFSNAVENPASFVDGIVINDGASSYPDQVREHWPEDSRPPPGFKLLDQIGPWKIFGIEHSASGV
jgi:hypothetical protein